MSTSLSDAARLRLFVAVVPETAALQEIERAIDAVRGLDSAGTLRWMKRERLHLTLRFLGSVEESFVPALHAACDEVARQTLPFDLTLEGAGAFGSVARASVVWLGASVGADRLCTLAAALDARIEALGFEREARVFTPHLTLARSKRPSSQRALVDQLARTRTSTSVRELVLMRSHLGASAHYEALARVALGGGSANA